VRKIVFKNDAVNNFPRGERGQSPRGIDFADHYAAKKRRVPGEQRRGA
jgi:hypothetical protein